MFYTCKSNDIIQTHSVRVVCYAQREYMTKMDRVFDLKDSEWSNLVTISTFPYIQFLFLSHRRIEGHCKARTHKLWM